MTHSFFSAMTDDNRFPAERAKSILAILHEQGRVVAGELAVRFSVSEDSIRRDLRDLASQGLCQRVHGGAVLLAPGYAPFPQRTAHVEHCKADLAGLTCSLLVRGQVIFLDAGTTNLAIAHCLPQKADLTIVTTSPQIAIVASQRERVKVVLIGGCFSPSTGGVLGAEALAQIQRLRVDVSILGVCAVDSSKGIWAMNSEDAALKRGIVAASSRVIVTASSEKLGAQGTYHVATLSEVDDIVVDALAPTFHLKAFADAGIAVHQLAA